MNKKYTIAALIGVRGGSKRVKNKNSRNFANSNLLDIKVKHMLNITLLDKVIVNSEDDELLSIAHESGAETIKRDPEFASDEISTSDYYQNIAENCEADIIVSVTATTPLIEKASYVKGIRKFLEVVGQGYDSVTSCSPDKEFLYMDGKPLYYYPSKQVRSQDLPEIVSVNYGYSILFRKDMIRNKNIVGKNPLFVPLSKVESVDIDTHEDFYIAETLYNQPAALHCSKYYDLRM